MNAELDILLVPVVIQFNTQPVFEVDHMFDEVQALHEDPDIDVNRLACAQAKPVFGRPGGKLLSTGRGVVRLIVVVSEAQVQYPPIGADIGGMIGAMSTVDMDSAMIGVVDLSAFYDDQVANANGIGMGTGSGGVLCRVGVF